MSDQSPQVGDLAPELDVLGPEGTPVRLADLLARGPIVLYFYPKDDTTGCTIEACAFRDLHEHFVAAGAQVVGVSRDDAASHARFAKAQRLPFLLLSDPQGVTHERYGVRRHLGGLLRGRITYVIDRAGVIRDVFNSQLRFATHAERSLEIVRALAAPAVASPR